MKVLGKLFVKGLITILPVALTLYVLYWLAMSAESLLGGLLRWVLGERLYLPGMGIVAGAVLVLGVGALLRLWLFRWLLTLTNALLERIPLIKSVYSSTRDLMSFLDSSKTKEFDKVVMVSVGPPDIRLIGLATREDFEQLPDGIGDDRTLAVYLPMSYQLGGFTVFVARQRIRPVDMTVEEAMRFALTAAVSTQNQEPPARQDEQSGS